MRLLDVDTVLDAASGSGERIVEVDSLKVTPKYAILSHTWNAHEVTFQDLSARPLEALIQDPDFKEGALKIRNACQTAQKDGYKYLWIDTCCINKQSSSELSAAIHSMFRWYKEAQMCFTYLSDVGHIFPADGRQGFFNARLDTGCSSNLLSEQFIHSMWFRRGWTLQELLAPRRMTFLDRDYNKLGSRKSLSSEIQTATGIHPRYFSNWSRLSKRVSIATKFSWMARRVTTRPEDMTYAMLGLLGVGMEIRYGEDQGAYKAFMRLQNILIEEKNDESIFAWKSDRFKSSGLLAPSFRCFYNVGDIQSYSRCDTRYLPREPYSMSNGAVRFPVPLAQMYQGGTVGTGHSRMKIPLNCWKQTPDGPRNINIELQMINGVWQRVNCHRLRLSKPVENPAIMGSVGGHVTWSMPIQIPNSRTMLDCPRKAASITRFSKHRYQRPESARVSLSVLSTLGNQLKRLPRLVP